MGLVFGFLSECGIHSSSKSWSGICLFSALQSIVPLCNSNLKAGVHFPVRPTLDTEGLIKTFQRRKRSAVCLCCTLRVGLKHHQTGTTCDSNRGCSTTKGNWPKWLVKTVTIWPISSTMSLGLTNSRRVVPRRFNDLVPCWHRTGHSSLLRVAPRSLNSSCWSFLTFVFFLKSNLLLRSDGN